MLSKATAGSQKVDAGFWKRPCSNKDVEWDRASRRNHPALGER
jgi:hypothetical protein